MQAYAEKLAAEHGVDAADAEAVKKVARAVMDGKVSEVRARMGEREKAVRKNREVEEELEKLRLQRDAEVRVLEKMKGKR